MLYAGVRTAMLNDSTLSGIVGNRVMQSVLPLNFTVPAVTTTIVNSRYMGVDTGAKSVTATVTTMDVSAWALTYFDSASAIAAIHNIFDLYSGTLPDGTEVLFTAVESIPDMYEEDTRLYRASVTIKFIHL